MSFELDERVKDEIEALEAILMDDVSIQNDEKGLPRSIKTVVLPSTADDINQQYVCVTLEVILTDGYPDNEPEVKLRNPRGLDDEVIDQLNRQISEKCIEFLGQPVIFELIELIREKLTESNMPSCQCAVCLYDFKQGDQFTKTECYHYFHSYCLACHLINTERLYCEEQEKLPAWQKVNNCFQPTCPVCREPIKCDLDSLKEAAPPLELENQRQFEATAELRALQARMAALYLYQQSRGGIIDVEAEESKLLLVTGTGDNSSPEDEQNSDSTSDTPPGPSIQHSSLSPNHCTSSTMNSVEQSKQSTKQTTSQTSQDEREREVSNHHRMHRSYRSGRKGRGRYSRHNSNR